MPAPSLTWIDEHSPLPPTALALGPGSDAPGLLAVGGSVTPKRLEEAYRLGVFPWYSPGDPPLWWTPDPRMVLPVAGFRLSHSLRKTLRRFIRDPRCEVRIDSAFRRVMAACADTPRDGQGGTWIVPEMVEAYTQLHERGFAHSVESWLEGELVGGLYGMALGKVFFGESMFARAPDASKVALVRLVERLKASGYRVIDCQQATAHLASLGAREIDRKTFAQLVEDSIQYPPSGERWTPGK